MAPPLDPPCVRDIIRRRVLANTHVSFSPRGMLLLWYCEVNPLNYLYIE
jgi:hypothetical protein